MKLFVGLGNPGAKYARNRHNIGFMAVDAIAAAHGFSPWRAKFGSVVAEGRLATAKVMLLKPETFMNLSGDAVRAASTFHKIDPPDIVVFHDELDLAPGRVRVKTGGGHAGHNGLRSIAAHLGPDFVRVRLGIGHPGDKRLVTNYVLGDFGKGDDWLAPLLDAVADAAPDLAEGDGAAFSRRLGEAAGKGGAAGKPAPSCAPAPAARPEPQPEPEPRSPLQRLIDRFR